MNWAYYLLQANIYLVVFYGFYKFLLDKETYFTLNRIYLVAAGLLSLAIPFIQMEWLTTQPLSQPIYTGVDQLNQLMTEVTVDQTQTEQFSPGSMLAIFYVLGVIFFVLKFFYQLFKVNRLLRNPGRGTAFSFFNRTVIDPALPDFDTIKHHEEVHGKQLHSLDVLFFEVLSILTWFNPIIYAYKHSLKGIHEYLADEEASKFIGNKERYALLLVSNALGIPLSKLTNSFFNQSLLKKRIYMLNQEKSPKKALLKYGLFLPLFALALVLSSATLRNNEQLKDITAVVTLDQPLAMVQDIVEPANKQSWDDFYAFLGRNLRYPNEALKDKLQGDAHIKFTLKDGGVENIGAAGHTLGAGIETAVMRSLLAYQKLKNLTNGNYLLTVTFRLKDSDKPIQNTDEITLDGYTKLNTLAVTGESTVHDFVSIDKQPSFPGGMPKFYEYLGRNLKYPAAAKANKIEGKVFLSFIVEIDGHLNHIKVDRKLGYGTDEEAVRVLEESPNWTPGLLNGKAVRVKYNIPINFGLAPETKGKTEGIQLTFDKNASYDQKIKPLYIIDGIKAEGEGMKALNPNEIESINVYAKATEIYGEEGKNGVIDIKLKKKIRNTLPTSTRDSTEKGKNN